MQRVVLTLVLAGFVLVVGQAIGAKPDTVYFREPGKKKDTTFIGKVVEESPSGIKVKPTKGEVKNIPALQIAQIEYGAGLDVLSGPDFRNGDNKLTIALKETAKSTKREDGLRKALLAFQTLDANDKLSGMAAIHRYFQFRIAQTLYYQVREDAGRRDTAITALKEYKMSFADGWEIVPALQLLSSLQEEKGDIEAASQTFSDLAKLDGISAAMKLQSQLKGARLMMLAKKFADAEAKLKEIALPADDPQRAFVDAYLIQSRIAQKGNLDGVDAKLQQILRASKDKNLLALVHNSLGDYYRAKADLDRAFWEYCKVDMMYNLDREEHAKALYYLSKFYDRPRNNVGRAEETLTRLKSSQFDGTLFQRQAMAAKKTSE